MIIEWSIGNTCNLSCEYCPDILKSGSIPLPDPERFSQAVEYVYKSFDELEITFIGGEPTIYPGLVLALSRLSLDPNKKFKIESNATPDIEWWKAHRHFFKKVDLSYHKESVSLDHVILVAETLKEASVSVSVKLPTLPNDWESTISGIKALRSKGIKAEIQLLYKNFTKGNNIYFDYSSRQMDYYYEDKGVKKDDVPETVEFKKTHKLNNYLGHFCKAGIDQMIIDKFGYVFRGWCEQGGPLGNVFEEYVSWPTDAIVCRKTLCSNGFDLNAKKSSKSWNIY